MSAETASIPTPGAARAPFRDGLVVTRSRREFPRGTERDPIHHRAR